MDIPHSGFYHELCERRYGHEKSGDQEMFVSVTVIDETTALVEVGPAKKGAKGERRTMRIVVGGRYEIQPPNPQKKRNRGRICEVRRFYDVYSAYSGQAGVVYVDNGKAGRVDLGNLVDMAERV